MKFNEKTSGSFAGNINLPVHRWFRYSAGFSGAWATNLVSKKSKSCNVNVFDPFAGVGTTLLAAEKCEVESLGIDSHSFISRVAQAKLSYRASPEVYISRCNEVLRLARTICPSLDNYAPLIRKCYTDEVLGKLDCLRNAINCMDDDSEYSRLSWLTLVSILRSTSHVGTANWQYIIPSRRKSKVCEPFDSFRNMMRIVYNDMVDLKTLNGPRAKYSLDDARYCSTVATNSCNLVITSPPYPNNYDYADATRLELTFLGEIQGWGDLQLHIRRHLLRSCTQHVPNKSVDLKMVLDQPEVIPIRSELHDVCRELGRVRLTRGGKKTYHNMIGCYFLDLAQVWIALRRVCTSPSEICFVIGDSAPYGVYVPVIEWLGKLALGAGFDSYKFEKTRDRNIKWKNRKHRVPLCEGRLWVKG